MNEGLENTGDKADAVLIKPPKPLAAGIASLFGSGLGHVYAGRMRRGLVLYGVGLVVVAAMTATIAYVPFEGFNVAAAVCLLVVFRLCCAIDSFRSARRNRNVPRRGYQRWLVYVTVWLFGPALLAGYHGTIAPLWLQHFVIPAEGGGMTDTLMPGDRLLVEKHRAIGRQIWLGDIIVYFSDGPGSTIFVQRVIGLAGDTIGFKDDKLYRNGVQVDEPYAKLDGIEDVIPLDLSYIAPIVVPEGEVYMAGDNRRGSSDSRLTGPVPLEDVVGHVMAIYWSNVPRGVDSSNPIGTIRWNRIGKRMVNDAR